MITRTNAFQTSDNKTHASLEEAQKHELELLWAQSTDTPDMPSWVLANQAKIIDILTTTATSKVRARKVNGATKKRKPDVAAVNRELQDGK